MQDQPTQTRTLSRRASWLRWNWTPHMDPKVVEARTWASLVCIWLALVGFQACTQVVSQSSIFEGPSFELLPSSATDPAIGRTMGWTVTIMRGMTAVAMGQLANKIGHKNACVVGMVFILAAFPFILAPQMKQAMLQDGVPGHVASSVAFTLFILFRLFMAAGAAGLLVLQSTLTAKFIAARRVRNRAVKCGPAPLYFAGVLVPLLFINGVVSSAFNPSGLDLARHWQMLCGVFLGVVVLALFAFLAVGMEFGIDKHPDEPRQLADADKKRHLLKWLVKQPWVIALIFASTLGLYARIEPAGTTLMSLWRGSEANRALQWNVSTGTQNTNLTQAYSIITAMQLWQVMLYGGFFLGVMTLGRWSNTRYSISRFIGVSLLVGSAFWAVSWGLGAMDLSDPGVLAPVLVTGLLGSTCIMGPLTMTFIIPYRWGMDPKQITNYVSLNWTIIFLGYSVLDIATSFVGTAGIYANVGTVANWVIVNPEHYPQMFVQQNFPTIAGRTYDQQMAEYFRDIRNIVLGTDVKDAQAFVRALQNKPGSDFLYYGVTPDVFDWSYLERVGVLKGPNSPAGMPTIGQSLDALGRQYVPQACVIMAVPPLAGVAFLCIKPMDRDMPFSLRHFLKNHTHFSNLKRLSNALFKTRFRVVPPHD